MEKPNFLFNNQQNMMSGLLSEIMIDQQVRLFRKKTLYREIDEALAVKNKDRFMTLTSELRQILAFEAK
ncbi:IDEAL domain-containing protein [Brevibacillus dissolubilis]|uniref:IDEAL domain-containing protein n=1 Tax=Brevibacillus dissolubilis TaxID=1844116 RepID=UPI001115BB06|nr:IDEAL domain-containing protein [Brevibacillus dissolubilis]